MLRACKGRTRTSNRTDWAGPNWTEPTSAHSINRLSQAKGKKRKERKRKKERVSKGGKERERADRYTSHGICCCCFCCWVWHCVTLLSVPQHTHTHTPIATFDSFLTVRLCVCRNFDEPLPSTNWMLSGTNVHIQKNRGNVMKIQSHGCVIKTLILRRMRRMRRWILTPSCTAIIEILSTRSLSVCVCVCGRGDDESLSVIGE